MKLYTLTYDANLPTKQQINVPTNTDYKVGIKVTRNGKNVDLKTAEVMLGTLSADSGLTNGYVTFTKSAGDTASMTLDTLSIEHGYDESYSQGPNIHSQDGTQTLLSVDLTPYAGMELFAKDVKLFGAKSRSTPMTEEYVLSNLAGYWNIPSSMQSVLQNGGPLVVGANGIGKIFCYAEGVIKTEICQTIGWPIDKPGFFMANSTATQIENIQESYVIQEGDILYIGKNLDVGTGYAAAMVQFTFGTPFNADFKLVTNVYKSQVGDQSVGLQSASTVNLTGEFADGTDFSYDIVAK